MANEILKIDENHRNVLGGITDNAAQEIRMLRVDPATGRLLVSMSGGSGIVIDTTVIVGGTTGQLLYNNAGTVGELSVVTYPSLTELSYVKGVTSSIQSQLNAKGTGTVTSVSVTTANGVSGTVATATTTPAITIVLGAITPTSVNGLTFVASAVGFTIAGGTTSKTLTVPLDASVSGTNTGDNAANTSSLAVTAKATQTDVATGTDDTKYLTSLAVEPLANQYLAKQTIINGGFTVNQRGYVSAATLASGEYGHDRWKAGSGGGNYSFTQLPQSTVITIASGKSLIQVVEDKNVIGGTYTLSWTGTATARYAVDSATPAGSYVASPIAITGQTAGTVMSIEFTDGTLSNVQLNAGSVALPFMPKSYAEELRDCMRYYERFGGEVGSVYNRFSGGHNISTTQNSTLLQFKVPKRNLTYTLETNSTASKYAIYYLDSLAACTSVPVFQNANTMSTVSTSILSTVASGLTAGQGSELLQNNNADAYLAINSEL